jgi:tRNA-guanine family transglycosylase
MNIRHENNDTKPIRILETESGVIEYPAYIPVTTFGNAYPLDALIQPYLPRLAPAVMVSFHYAQAMKKKPRIPIFVDSGGFAALFEGSKLIVRHGNGILEIEKENEIEELTPMKVLDFQEQWADVAFTLDFPIPPSTEKKEAEQRRALTVSNAIWALENRRRKGMKLFCCLQGLNVADYRKSAKELSVYGFDGFAIGGLVPRAKDGKLIENVVNMVRETIGDRPLHVFGLGKPETAKRLFKLGVSSVDSSAYVKMAADGKSWIDPTPLDDPAVTDRLLLALKNLRTASANTPFGARQSMLGGGGLH